MELLRSEATGSFSDLWYRVGSMRPRVGVHCRVVRQLFGAHTVFILEDPTSGQYYRLTESAHYFLGMLDGERTVQDAWDGCVSQIGDTAPTQRECVELLSRLQLFGLLTGGGPLAPELVEQRRREARLVRIKSRTGFGMSLTVPLLDPDPILSRMQDILRLVFSKAGFAVWLAVVLTGLYHVATHWHKLGDRLNSVLDPSNLVWITLIFVLLRAWHELGHAAACKAMGARSSEIGVMLMMLLLPFPYCDASSAWRLPEVWKRVVVSAGGVIFELFAAAIAAVIWARSNDPTVVLLCFNIMFVSGVTTVLFNLNPLLRYDGYYILSDLTGIANLWQRSRELWKFLLERLVFGLRRAKAPPLSGRREFWIVFVYGLLSLPYRMMITFSIVFFIWSNPHYSTIGAVLAAVAFVFFLVWPLLQAIWYLATSPALLGRRSRAIGVTVAALAVLVLIFAVIPVPAAAYAPGVVHAAQREPIRAGESGFVDRVLVEPGQRVRAGDVMVVLRSMELESARDRALAGVQVARAEFDEASIKTGAEREVAIKQLAQAEAEVERLEKQVAKLTVRAGIDGVVAVSGGAPNELSNSVGRFAPRGALLGYVLSESAPVVRAVIEDRDQAWVFREGTLGPPAGLGVTASVRFRGDAGREYPAELVRIAPASTKRVDDAALATEAQGDVVMDPAKSGESASLRPQFLVEVRPELEPGRAHELAPVGIRAKVRLKVASEPLVSQWWRRLVQLFGEGSQI